MRPDRSVAVSWIWLAGLILPCAAAQVSAGDSFSQAQALLREGRDGEAFVQLLRIPGAEYLAVQLARPHAEEFLSVLRGHAGQVPLARAYLVEGDLLLALGRKDEALLRYRQVSGRIGPDSQHGWEEGHVPADEYFVEPPVQDDGYGSIRPLAPPVSSFAAGPGSHRDNWLIRRFIALEAWDDAGNEFARVWDIHRRSIEPCVLVVPAFPTQDGEAEPTKWLIEPVGFDGRAFQFAIDYAFFLKRRGEVDRALGVLMEPILAMDMDRNPNTIRRKQLAEDSVVSYPERTNETVSRRRGVWRGASAGISRKEYVRLAFGEFNAQGKTDILYDAVQEQIAHGQNRARRVMSRLLMHEGRLDESLAYELAYIEAEDFDPLTSAYRRGVAYEDAGELEAAAAEYERALVSPYSTPVLPDADEETVQRGAMSQMASVWTGPNLLRGQAVIQQEVIGRLLRIYAALDQMDVALESVLRQLDTSELLLTDFDTLDQMIRRFRGAGQESRIKAWLTKRAAEVSSASARANLCWLAGDADGAAETLAVWVGSPQGELASVTMDSWKERFRQAGPQPYRILLRALVQANPQDARTRLELLGAEGIREGQEVIRTLELLLGGEAAPAFVRGKGTPNRTQFRNYYHLAYHLMRLYERNPDDEDKLVALGFRVLEGQKPFQRSDNLLRDYRADWNDSVVSGDTLGQDILNCLYVFLAHLSRTEDIERAAALAAETGSIPLINQANRLRPASGFGRLDPTTGHRAEYEAVEIRTLGLPEGVRVLTNRDDVRAIASALQWPPDEGMLRQAWIGTSWGLVRYRVTERPARQIEILQIPLGVGVTVFCQTPAGLYVGTRDGLYRLDDPNEADPVPVRIRVEVADRRERDRVEWIISRTGERREERIHEPFEVTRLLWWQESLWIGADRGVYRYQPDAKQAQYYDRQEGSPFVGLGRLWCRTSVLDPVTGEFQAIDPGITQWRLIGATSEEIWADVWVDDEIRHRPALLDPQTLELRVLPIMDARLRGRLQNHEFSLIGEFEGRTWLAAQNPSGTFIYDRVRDELKPFEAPLPSPETWASGEWRRLSLAAVRLDLTGDRGPRYRSVPAPGGRLLVGNAIVREWAEDNLGFDDDTGMSHHVQDLEGGLFEIDPGMASWRKVGSPQEELSDFYVKRLVRDGGRLYVCTNGGVTILSWPDGEILGRITVSDGLPSNKVEDVARIGDRLYLACELGDEGGGLAIQDLRTGLIQVMTMADGLKSDKIKGLRAEGNKLHILYGTIYSVRARNTHLEGSLVAPVAEELKRRWEAARPDTRVRTFTSSILDTQTGRLADGNEVLPAAYAPEMTAEALPILGGLALCREAEGSGPIFIGGTHGLVIGSSSTDQSPMALLWPNENVRVAQSARQAQIGEAAHVDIPGPLSPERLQQFVGHANPYVAAKALAATHLLILNGRTGFAPVIGQCVTHPCYAVRTTAVYLLSKIDDTSVVGPLETALSDDDASIRAIAAMSLARRGHVPDMSYFEEIFRREDTYRAIPFGATSNMGPEASSHYVYEALACDVSEDVFTLLMTYPPHIRAYDNATKVYPALGDALREHPEMAHILLQAADDRPGDGSNKDFAMHVFRCAGKDMLGILHEALTSNDRVVRSNAARACGAIGDPSSVSALIKALDMESGLARASVVWALGELKAKEALPHLVRLYVDARNDERRRQGSGFRMAQSAAVIQAQYDSLSKLDAVETQWNELRQAALPPPVDPRRNETLLSPQLILAAVAKIGSDEAQEFYRTLAGEKDMEARREAAIHLAEGGTDSMEENAPILKNLLEDSDWAVRIHAAVSLLVLGETVAKDRILEELTSAPEGRKALILSDLGRVTDVSQLEFAHERIAAIAFDTLLSSRVRSLARSLLAAQQQ